MATVSTIPPGLAFVDALANGLLGEARGDPLGLADAIVLLPTRRACRSLREAFLRQARGDALILPRIKPVGDVDEDELVLDGGLDREPDPAVPPLRRQFLLTQFLLRAPALAGRPTAPRLDHALRLASELAAFLDEARGHDVPMAALDSVVAAEMAEHWRITRDFLAVLRDHWPAILQANGVLDPADRRIVLLRRLVETFRTARPGRRIVAAGITTTQPAGCELLAAIADLPRGEVVLPGLDVGMDQASWEGIGPTHPQFALKRLVEHLGVERAEVRRWPDGGVDGGSPERAALLTEVMRPAETSALWQDYKRPPEGATRGMVLETCPDLPSEAMSLAGLMREALETPGRTAALVTPDRTLARRVAAELARWGIDVNDSAGTPLDQTPPGGLLLLAAHLAIEDAHPITLLSTLKHPLVRGGEDQATFRARARLLERRLLRGPRIAGGLAGLRAELLREGDDRRGTTALAAFLERLEHEAAPLADLAAGGPCGLGELVRRHVAFAEHLTADADGRPDGLWSREAGEAARELMAEIEAEADALPPIEPAAYPGFLAVLMAAKAVRPRADRHPRLSILGVLESRLQHADLMLLGGLNEGSWPAAPDNGPWLNGAMRETLGLPRADARVGASAHDFVQLAAAREVVLSRAQKDASGRPTVPSRWVERLRAVLRAADIQIPAFCFAARLPWSAALDEPEGGRVLAERPAPCPPVEVRPRSLSVTDVELWARDPYALYAKRVLKLAPLDPIDADPSYAERGTVVHAILHAFVQRYPGPARLPDDAEEELILMGRRAFRELERRPQARALWWPRFERVAGWFIAEERKRRAGVARVVTEVAGELSFPAPVGAFVLRAKADRIEIGRDGTLTIIDYKTGGHPGPEEVAAGFAPQLPLEAAIAAAGGFEDVPSGAVAGLAYWRLSGGEPAGEVGEPVAKDGTAADAAEDALDRLKKRVIRFDKPTTAYRAQPFPKRAPRYNPYAHLERAQAWGGGEDAE